MTEKKRKARNTSKLAECYEPFGRLVAGVLAGLEASGFRPRIQEAWRSPGDQLKAYTSGHSKLKYGFHNVTGAKDAKEALAVDVLDDAAPLAPPTPFLLHLAAEARARGLETGILWGLPASLQNGVEEAIGNQEWDAPVKVGWDPCHVQVAGITPAEAKSGERRPLN